MKRSSKAAIISGICAAVIIWGYWVDKKKPDRFEIIGSVIVLIGVAVMFYFPR